MVEFSSAMLTFGNEIYRRFPGMDEYWLVEIKLAALYAVYGLLR